MVAADATAVVADVTVVAADVTAVAADVTAAVAGAMAAEVAPEPVDPAAMAAAKRRTNGNAARL